MARLWLAGLLLLSSLALGLAGNRRSNWYHCECRWGSWLSWNDCSKSCYGYRYRERWVYWERNRGCTHGHDDCYPGGGDLDSEWNDWEDCNTYCPYGSRSGSGRSKYCSCPRGRYGTCCTNRASCGSPPSVSHGSYSYSGSYYGDTASYSCHSDYRMVGGSSSRTCEASWGYEYGYWSGSTPSCRFARTCRSNPCQNGARCEDLIERYRCHCRSGWEGVNCERDVQPPLVSSCPNDVTILTSEHTETVHWREPVFYDPHGFEVRVTGNYDHSEFAFPWGDFSVNYNAYKPNNGMRASCLFTIKVRPHPCPPRSAPKRGLLVCNGWQTDMGRFCLASCLERAYLPLGYDPAAWLVCGASGRWSPAPLATQCLDRHHTAPVSLLPQPRSCQDSQALDHVRAEFVQRLNASHFGRVFCQDMAQQCHPSNVAVLCSDD